MLRRKILLNGGVKLRERNEPMTEQALPGRARARELGIVLGTMSPGPLNAITDVAGICVGHITLIRGSGPLVRGVGPVRTGVTAILPHGDNVFTSKVPAAATVFNGFGKTIGLVQIAELGQLETPILLTNTLNVGKVADALVGYMIEQNPAIGVTTGTVNPVVCECNDGFLNDIGGRHVGEQEVRAALLNASEGPVAEGNIGAGTGMMAYLLIAGVPVGRELERSGQQTNAGNSMLSKGREQGSIIVVLATDAPLDARQLGRLTRRVPLGLARTGTHGGHGSGDLAIAFSTAQRIPHDGSVLTHMITVLNEQNPVIDALFSAVVEATEEAVINALCTAHPMDGRDDHHVEALPLNKTLALLRHYGVEGSTGA
jgi:D-aminopeptidase